MNSSLTPLPALDFTQLSTLITPPARIENDSRRLQHGDIFLACRGEYTDGRDYIPQAIAAGAAAVIWDQAGDFVWPPEWHVPQLGVPELSANVGILAAWALDYPAQHCDIVGVTGTNGKTSLTHWLAQAWTLAGQRAAVIGTVGNGVWPTLHTATHTTPDPVRLQQLLREFQQQHTQSIAIEVSSHGLDQYRVNGVPFRCAVFTNLTRDHLDYHGSMEEYGARKRRLFFWENLRTAVINIDDPFGRTLAAHHSAQECFTYGLNGGDIHPLSLDIHVNGIRTTLNTPWGRTKLQSPLLGRFNVQNLMAALAVLVSGGLDLEHATQLLSRIQPAKGRMQRLGKAHHPTVLVDYAHTPDALEKALQTLRDIRTAASRLIVVFGCGGDRDRGKRPQMGRIAAELADIVILTSDNPRTENPDTILDDIARGIPSAHTASIHRDSDRQRAIEYALSIATPDDIVLIAGKGHENYQDIHGVKHPFDDAHIVSDTLQKLDTKAAL